MTKYRGAVRFFLSSRINAVTAVALGISYFIVFYASIAIYVLGTTAGSLISPEIQKLISVALVSVMYILLPSPRRVLFIKSDADFLFNYSLPTRIMARCAAVYGSLLTVIIAVLMGIFTRLFSISTVPVIVSLLFLLLMFLTSVFMVLSSMFRANRTTGPGIMVSILLTLSYLIGNPLSPAAITGNQWQFGLVSVFALMVMWIYISMKSLRENSLGTLYFRGGNDRQVIKKNLDFENHRGIGAFSYLTRTVGFVPGRSGGVFRFRYRTILLITLSAMVALSILYILLPQLLLPYLFVITLITVELNSFVFSYAVFRLRYERLWISWMPFSRVHGMRAYITSSAFAASRMFYLLAIPALVFLIFPNEEVSFINAGFNFQLPFILLYIAFASFPASVLSIFLSTIVAPEPVRDDLIVTPSLATGIVSFIPILYVYISALVAILTNDYIYVYSFAALAVFAAIVLSSHKIMDFSFRHISASLYT
ncbi:MAG: hypothetical protein M1431_00870 [Candidatus Thermoplasmatota archaeon]|nr:hypothetical protein [Candidatus Thermoplasmatota archaeon]